MVTFSLASHHASKPKMLEHDCALWQKLIQDRCGLFFSASRLRFLRQSLWERMLLHHIQSYRDYYHYIAFDSAAKAEWQALLELLLNHETSFFRHQPSYTALTEYVLPALMHQQDQAGTISMWSAGCSMGQEVYSLAMAFLEYTDPAACVHLTCEGTRRRTKWRARIIGSDVSHQAVEKARRGQYTSYEMRSLPVSYRQRYFTAIGEGSNVMYQIAERVKSVVEMGCVNLHDLGGSPFSPLPYMGGKGEGVDIIFCQNVLIYFTHENRRAMAQNLCQRLRPGGYLFLGPAEAVDIKLSGVRAVRLANIVLYQCVA